MTWSTTDDAGASTPVTEAYSLIAGDVSSNTNIIVYCWLAIPIGKTAGDYTATIDINAVGTGTLP